MTPRAGLALVTAFGATALAYGLLRVAQRLAGPDPDPTLVLYSPHSGFFWRAWIAAYLGGMAGLAAWLAARSEPRREAVARVAAALVALATAFVVLAAALFP